MWRNLGKLRQYLPSGLMSESEALVVEVITSAYLCMYSLVEQKG